MVEEVEKINEPEDKTNAIKHETLQFVFKPDRDQFPNKHYHEDGNPEMYTTENTTKREDLFDNLIVKEAIEKFIIDSGFILTPNKNTCSKSEYLKVFSKCAMVLRNDFRDSDEIIKLLEEEFD